MKEKQLIEAIKGLNEIKPRKEWAYLLKSQLFTEPAEKKIVNWEIEKFIENWKLIISNSFSRRLAYALATFLFVIVGALGFAQYTLPGDALFSVRVLTEQSQAALSGQTGLKQNMATLGNRINDLALIAKEGRKSNIASAIDEVKKSASELAKTLDNKLVEDAGTAKELAAEVQKIRQLQTLADLSDSPEIKSLNDALAPVVENEIKDLEKATLTEEQIEKLDEVKALYDKEDYSAALEKILLISR